MSDALPQFLAAMEAAGVQPAEPIAQRLAGGGLIRFRCEGDRKPNGWAVLHLDGRAAGAFGWYKGGIREKWRAEGSEPISDEERARLQREWRETSRRREAKKREAQAVAADEAARLWRAARPADPLHPYLNRKTLPGEGLRQNGDRLLVPMRDIDGRLWNVQRIAPDGFKTFLPGGRTAGLLCLIGGGGSVVCVGEGYATMAAVRVATGKPVAAAFSGENLERVARLLRGQWPGLDIIVCADDDAHLIDHPNIRKNLGLEYAKAAAAAVAGRLAVPNEGRE